MPEDKKLWNVNEGITGRDGGPYLDEEQARAAEEIRARIEKREPNHDEIQPYAGIMLVPAATLINTETVNSNPSMEGSTALAKALADSAFGSQPVATVPGDDLKDDSIQDVEKSDDDNQSNRSGRRSH